MAEHLTISGCLVAERPGCRLLLASVNGTPTLFVSSWSAALSLLKRERGLFGLWKRLPIRAGVAATVTIVIDRRPVAELHRHGSDQQTKLRWDGLFGSTRIAEPAGSGG